MSFNCGQHPINCRTATIPFGLPNVLECLVCQIRLEETSISIKVDACLLVLIPAAKATPSLACKLEEDMSRQTNGLLEDVEAMDRPR